jgi:hypothetical protein
MPLELEEFDGVIRLAAGGNGMRAVVTGFTIEAGLDRNNLQ